MRVLPDTPIWSAAFRRSDGSIDANRKEMEQLVANGLVELLGPIRQELLSGIREKSRYETVRERLRTFVDIPIVTEDYEEAAVFYNRCRGKGIQGSSTDFLICVMAVKHNLAIFTNDQDFVSYSRHLPIRLHSSATNV